MKNQREFMDKLAKKLNITDPADWHKVTIQDFRGSNGRGLLKLYSGSPSKAIRSILPELNLQVDDFVTKPKNYWTEMKNQRVFMETFAKQLNILQPDDWYRVTAQDFVNHKGRSILALYNDSPSKAITSILPELNLQLWKFPRQFLEASRCQQGL